MAQTNDGYFSRWKPPTKPTTTSQRPVQYRQPAAKQTTQRPVQYRQPAASGPTVPPPATVPAWLRQAAQRFQGATRQVGNAVQTGARAVNQAVGQNLPQAIRESGEPFRQWMTQASPDQRRQDIAGYISGAWNNRRQLPHTYQTAGQPEPVDDGRIFGVHYGPNWVRPDYVPPVDWRMGEGAAIQMTPDEYIRRRNALEPIYQQDTMNTPRQYQRYTGNSYQAWLERARRTPGVSHDITSPWRAANPRPTGFFQTDQEYILRSNAAPTGYGYQPFGSSYYKKPTLPPVGTPPPSTGGGGYGYGGRGYGGSGGYGGGGGYQDAASFYNQLTNWRILEIQGG